MCSVPPVLFATDHSNTYRKRLVIDTANDGKLRPDLNKHVTTLLFTPVVGSD